jgi:hypothetical protein
MSRLFIGSGQVPDSVASSLLGCNASLCNVRSLTWAWKVSLSDMLLTQFGSQLGILEGSSSWGSNRTGGERT